MEMPKFKKAWCALAVVWFLASITLLLWSLLTDVFKPGLWWELYWSAVSILSPISFAAFAWDKWKAEREKSRISEKTLHLLAVLGGWPGAVLGQNTFRHKTLKPFFRLILVGIAWAHIIVVAICAFGGTAASN